MNASVSVIVPVYNSEGTLERSLESLINQTISNLEIVIVNDASTDSSADIIKKFKNKSDKIVSVELLENMGVHNARLAGLRKSSAPWIGFLDADDIARPDMFNSMYIAGTKNNTDIVICSSFRVSETRELIAPKIRFSRNKKVDSKILQKFCNFEFGTGTLWNKLYRREIIYPFSALHFPWRQDTNEDLLLNIGCFSNASSVYVQKDVLHEYVLNKGSVTSLTPNTKAYVNTYCAYAIAVSEFPGLGADALLDITRMYRTQLAWQSYHVEDMNELLAYRDKLQEAIGKVYESYPVGIALLSARTIPKSQLKRKIRSYLRNKFLDIFA